MEWYYWIIIIIAILFLKPIFASLTKVNKSKVHPVKMDSKEAPNTSLVKKKTTKKSIPIEPKSKEELEKTVSKVEKDKFEKIVFNLADNIAVLIEGGMSIEEIREGMPDLEDEAKEKIINMALNKNKAIKNCGQIYQLDSHRYKEVGKYENGRIYGYTKSGYRSFIEVGKYENGRIYGYTKSGYRSFIEVGKYENGLIFRLESNHHYKEVGKYSNDGGGPPSGSLLLLF